MTRNEPEKPPTLAEAAFLIAKLGGHFGKSDGKPRLKVM